MEKLPYCHAPCRDCPFRKDAPKGWLGEERIRIILAQTAFPCHKTINGYESDRLQCAGHMILKGNKNDFVALAKALNIQLNLKNQDAIFETEPDCIEHHSF